MTIHPIVGELLRPTDNISICRVMPLVWLKNVQSLFWYEPFLEYVQLIISFERHMILLFITHHFFSEALSHRYFRASYIIFFPQLNFIVKKEED